ncbi:LOW QUALITY PROTEIN: protein split ends [Ctenocephalides felis]|uniref:LOW QUALITY PROTEIN: protein split ends n=1 Tax=Ctenocephalides felis TaxID=7515 RepID=UPI000E6E5BAA|nr:LOW QUALITY PROTEIN: protein split ends [Ctenocephalides felis]
MVRETRHLWVGNLPDNIREDRIREHFKRYGRVQNVKLLSRAIASPAGAKETSSPADVGGGSGSGGITNGGVCAAVAFMDIKSASKAHNCEHKLDERSLTTEYYEPAAIPSSAGSSPAGSGYSGSSGSAASGRFQPNHGSTPDDHPTGFVERSVPFYERTVRQEPEGSYLRRSGGYITTDTIRGRGRDRLYNRNGPYTNTIIDRGTPIVHHRVTPTWYDGTVASSLSRGYGSVASAVVTPEVSYESEVIASRTLKKKGIVLAKSRSGSESPGGSISSSRSRSRSRSRSASRSPSRSSCSSSRSGSSSESRASSSPRSSRAPPSSAAQTAGPAVHSDDRRPLAICVRNLPARSSDTSLKDGLFHEYKKHGKVTWVKVVGQSADRYALVCFKKADDAEKALEVSRDKLFFGCKIDVAPYQGYDVDDNEFRPYEAELDEYHPKATRTLFIGNLEKDVTVSELRKHFEIFGEIIEIDIKKQGAISSYAFCQYSDICSVVKAMRTMDGEHLGNNRIKLGFGKTMPTNCVWMDGIAESVGEKQLSSLFLQYGPVSQVTLDRERGLALVFFEQILFAQSAIKETRGVTLRGRKLQVDFASRECQEAFYEKLDKSTSSISSSSERTAAFDVVPPVAATTPRFTRYDALARPRTASYSRSGNPISAASAGAVSPGGPPGANTPRGRARLTRYPPDYYDSAGEYTERRFRNYDEFSQGSGASHEDIFEHDVYAPPACYSAPDSSEHARRRSDKMVSPVQEDDFKIRSVQSVVIPTDLQTGGTTTFPPPDIRHLQKERVHLLEQLEECPSSGDEMISPKKRLKLDSMCLDNMNMSGLSNLEANFESTAGSHCDGNFTGSHHRGGECVEVRRLSDSGTVRHLHCSRRPSGESARSSQGADRISTIYTPHAVCKRRKTGGSSEGEHISRGRCHPLHSHHAREASGGESADGSRPGTPLCDERPEILVPIEPRRIPDRKERDRSPISLPLPRFAEQILHQNKSVETKPIQHPVASSPPVTVTSPRLANLNLQMQQNMDSCLVPPPASPPTRLPLLSPNSSDSEATPPSPTLEERIKSLDEKYEKWSGLRSFSHESASKVEAPANAVNLRVRHKLLELDINEVQPSDILKSVLARPSVFDEDSKRLENIGDKYEPKEFLPSRGGQNNTLSNSAVTPSKTSPMVSLQIASTGATTCIRSPRPKTPPSTPKSAPAVTSVPAKGLQYPFPSHPPIMMTPPISTTALTTCNSVTKLASPVKSSVAMERQFPQSSKILAKSLSVPGSTNSGTVSFMETSAMLNASVNKPVPLKVNTHKVDKCGDKNKVNKSDVNNKNRTVKKSKYRVRDNHNESDNLDRRKDIIYKASELIINPGIDLANSKKCDKCECEESDKQNEEQTQKDRFEKKKIEKHKLEKEGIQRECFEQERLENDHHGNQWREKECDETDHAEKDNKRLEKERLEKESLEKERLKKESLEKERLEKEHIEKHRLEHERTENERLEKENLEKERLERKRLDKERLVKERLEKERLEKERLGKERIEKERLEKERLEKERLEKERLEKERLEKERLEKERLEKERLEKERLENERLENERLEKERLEKERLEKERLEKERLEKERLEKERLEKERHEKERLEKERIEKERLEKERIEKERLEKERIEKERLQKDRLEKERLQKERLEKERLEKERHEKERLEKERHEKERLEKERLEKKRHEKERLDKERLEEERLEKERLEMEHLEKKRVETERLEKERLQKAFLEKERLEIERSEKERLEKDRIDKKRLEKERLEKDRLDKEHLERQLTEKECIMKECLERDSLGRKRSERDLLEVENIEKDRLVKEHIEKQLLEKELLEKKRLEKEHIKDRLEIKQIEKICEGNETLPLEEERLNTEQLVKEHKLEDLPENDKERMERLAKEKIETKKNEWLQKEIVEKELELELERGQIVKERIGKEWFDKQTSEKVRICKEYNDKVRVKIEHDEERFREVDIDKNVDKGSLGKIHDKFTTENSRQGKVKLNKESSDKQRLNKDKINKGKDQEDEKFRADQSDKEKKLEKDRASCKFSNIISTRDENIFESERLHENESEIYGKKVNSDMSDSELVVDTKHREKINTNCYTPAGIGCKRRNSLREQINEDNVKRCKLTMDEQVENAEMRVSKDSRQKERTKIVDKREKDKRMRLKTEKVDREEKSKISLPSLPPPPPPVQKKNNNKESTCINSHPASPPIAEDFLARLELRSSEEDEKQRAQRKELKEQKRQQQLQQIQQLQLQQEALQQQQQIKQEERFLSETLKMEDGRKKEKEKRISVERKGKDETVNPKSSENCRRKVRRVTNNSTDTSDSDEPKKHSIFDIVDDGPTYISMYDKVKARSCKNMQKQEEEKRQEKIKAKFSQLKQSRAKREEKKRSMSWEGDSDSEQDRSSNKQNRGRSGKSMITSSSEDEHNTVRKSVETRSDMSCESAAERTLSSRRGSRITSDTSEDENARLNISAIKTEVLESEVEVNDKNIVITSNKMEKPPSPNMLQKLQRRERNTKSRDSKVIFVNCSETKVKSPDINLLPLIKTEVKNEDIKFEIKTDPCKLNEYNKYSDADAENEDMVSLNKAGMNKDKHGLEIDEKINLDIRKKHRKKQKRQKGMECDNLFEKCFDHHESNGNVENIENDHIKSGNTEYRRHVSKKDKKRDKVKDDSDKEKTKIKKVKKVEKLENSIFKQDCLSNSVLKREEKIQNIFGSFSDDESALVNKDNDMSNVYSTSYNSDCKDDKFTISNENSKNYINDKLIYNQKHREESRRRKEKRKKDRDRKFARDNDISVDKIEKEGTLEEKLTNDLAEDDNDSLTYCGNSQSNFSDKGATEVDVFRFTDGDDSLEGDGAKCNTSGSNLLNKKESKEKKKKKKRNKEDKQNRKEHHTHQEKNKEKNLDNVIENHCDSSSDIREQEDECSDSYVEMQRITPNPQDLDHYQQLVVSPSSEYLKSDKISMDESINDNECQIEHDSCINKSGDEQETTATMNYPDKDFEDDKKTDVLDCKDDFKSSSVTISEVSLSSLTPEIVHKSETQQTSLDLPYVECNSMQSQIDTNALPSNDDHLTHIIKPIENKRKMDKLIPGFGVDIDDKIHENAVKSISDFIPSRDKLDLDDSLNQTESNKLIKTDKLEEKPRVIISQEETEDAVAALLGESFGSSGFEQYEGETSPIGGSTNIAENNIADEEAEEMRQAVQSLKSTEIDGMKPDTPQSENDLQIDTDTEDNAEDCINNDNANKNQESNSLCPTINKCYSELINKSNMIAHEELQAVSSVSEVYPVPSESIVNSNITKDTDCKTSTISKDLLSATTEISNSWVVNKAKHNTESKEITQMNDQPAAIEQLVAFSGSTSGCRPSNVVTQNRPVQAYMVTTSRVPAPQFSHIPAYTLQQTNVKNSSEQINIYKKPVGVMVSSNICTEVCHISHQPNKDFNAMDMIPRMQNLPTSSMVISTTTVVRPQGLQIHKQLNQTNSTQIPINMHNRSQLCSASQTPISASNSINRLPIPSVVSGSSNIISSSITDISSVPKLHIPAMIKTHVHKSIQEASGFSCNEFNPRIIFSNPEIPISVYTQSRSTICNSKDSTQKDSTQKAVSHNFISTNENNKDLNSDPVNLTEISAETVIGMTQTQYAHCNYTSENNRNVKMAHSEVRTPEIITSSRIIHQTSSGMSMQILSHMPLINTASNSVKIEEIKNVSAAETATQNPVIVSSIKQLESVSSGPHEQFTTNPLYLSEGDDKAITFKQNDDDPLDTLNADKSNHEKDYNELDENKDEKIKDISQDTNVDTTPKVESIIEKQSSENSEMLEVKSEAMEQKLEIIDVKEDSDCWSAKEVNIESVIKKVDALCSAEEVLENKFVENKDQIEITSINFENQNSNSIHNDNDNSDELNQPNNDLIKKESTADIGKCDDDIIMKECVSRGVGRRGRMRGRKSQSRVFDRQTSQVKRGKGISKRGRGGPKIKINDRKVSQDLSNDIYEFRDDSGEDNKEDDSRPRLILTIKGPTSSAVTGTNTSVSSTKPTSPSPLIDAKEDFSQPLYNTRKSRRLQERDGSRSTVDDVIEDVIKNGSLKGGQNILRRSTRQNIIGKAPDKVGLTEVRKSPRAKRLKDKSEASIDSSDEKCSKSLDAVPDDKIVISETAVLDNSDSKKVVLNDGEDIKASVASVKTSVIASKDTTSSTTSEVNTVVEQTVIEPESLTLIDPVTGELTVVCQSKEGQYIPVTTSLEFPASSYSSVITTSSTTTAANLKISESIVVDTAKSNAPPITNLDTPVIRSMPSIETTVTPKPHTLKSHVLSHIPKPVILQTCPAVNSIQIKPNTNSGINPQKSAVINIPQVSPQISTHPNCNINLVSKCNEQNIVTPRFQQNIVPKIQNIHTQGTVVKMANAKSATVSISSTQSNQYTSQKPICSTRVQTIQQIQNQKSIPTIQKSVQMNSNIITQTTNMAIKQNVQLIQGQHGQVVTTIQRHIVTGKSGNIPIPVQAGSIVAPNKSVILTAAVASPPLKQPLITGQPVVTGASGSRATVPHVSPQGPHSASPSPRGQVLQAALPMPVFEGAMSESVTHFPMIPIRGVNSRDLNPHINEVSGYSMYQQYLRVQELGVTRLPYLSRTSILPGLDQNVESHENMIRIRDDLIGSPPLELRRQAAINPNIPSARQITAVPHSLQSPHDRATDSPQVAQVYMHSSRIAVPHYPSQGNARFYEGTCTPSPAHRAPLAVSVSTASIQQQIGAASVTPAKKHSPTAAHQTSLATSSAAVVVATVAPLMTTRTAATVHQRAAMVPLQIDSLLMRLQRYPIMWQGLLALKNDQAAVQMHYMQGNSHIARQSLPCNVDGSTPPLRILQRMRLEQAQIEGVARKMQTPNEYCVLLALPCGHDQLDVLQQSRNLSSGFITYLQEKKAAGIVNIAAPGSNQVSYVVHIFPSCEFSNENLNRIDSDLLNRIADTSHLLIVIATV